MLAKPTFRNSRRVARVLLTTLALALSLARCTCAPPAPAPAGDSGVTIPPSDDAGAPDAGPQPSSDGGAPDAGAVDGGPGPTGDAGAAALHRATDVISGAARVSGGGLTFDVQLGQGIGQGPSAGGGKVLQGNAATSR